MGRFTITWGQNTFSGFWSPHIDAVISIYNARVDYAAFEYGGGTYSRIYRIKKDNTITKKIDRNKKNGHKDNFDRDEVFVSDLLDIPEDITKTLNLKR